MTGNAAPTRYSTLSIGLHWLMLFLIVAVYAAMELREFFPKDSPERNAMKAWHFTLGLTVLALVVIRIAARFMGPTPPIVPEPPAWQSLLAKLVHLGLYALMVLMPIGGWLILSGEAKAIPFWGIELPPLIGENKDFAELIEEVHEIGGKVGYFLIGLHAAAAIYHHRVVKDNTMRRMMPGG